MVSCVREAVEKWPGCHLIVSQTMVTSRANMTTNEIVISCNF